MCHYVRSSLLSPSTRLGGRASILQDYCLLILPSGHDLFFCRVEFNEESRLLLIFRPCIRLDAVVYEFPGWHDIRRHYGVTDGRFILIHYYEPDVNEWELFDLQTDPHEMQSIYGSPQVADQQKELEAELQRLRQELDVPSSDPPASLSGGRDNPTSAVIRGERKE